MTSSVRVAVEKYVSRIAASTIEKSESGVRLDAKELTDACFAKHEGDPVRVLDAFDRVASADGEISARREIFGTKERLNEKFLAGCASSDFSRATRKKLRFFWACRGWLDAFAFRYADFETATELEIELAESGNAFCLVEHLADAGKKNAVAACAALARAFGNYSPVRHRYACALALLVAKRDRLDVSLDEIRSVFFAQIPPLEFDVDFLDFDPSCGFRQRCAVYPESAAAAAPDWSLYFAPNDAKLHASERAEFRRMHHQLVLVAYDADGEYAGESSPAGAPPGTTERVAHRATFGAREMLVEFLEALI